MRVAIFSEVHGNTVALRAVLADIAAADADLVIARHTHEPADRPLNGVRA